MRFWWVNQNQTYDQEVSGGYLWSPKRKSNGARSYFYESMREIAPGDIVLSFKDTLIQAVGIAQSHCYSSPKPPEFGLTGPNWEKIGWKVDVRYQELSNKIKPSQHMNILAPLLPKRYAPLQKSGSGLQNVYLTELPNDFMRALAGLIGHDVLDLLHFSHIAEPENSLVNAATGLVEWEEHLVHEVEKDSSIDSTERQALVIARRGQGKYKENVSKVESLCRLTKVDRIEHLRASHLKPWRDSNNNERLDGENGLLLTPSIDHLMDRGFISFEGNGELLISPVAHKESLKKMGVPVGRVVNVGQFTDGQKHYLEYHRENVFLERRHG